MERWLKGGLHFSIWEYGWIDEKLSFNVHISNLVKKLKMKIGFNFRNKSCFTFSAKKKKLVEATFLSVIDHGDVLYMHAASSTLWSLDSVYHACLCFISNTKSLTHHCILYDLDGWPFTIHRQQHWYIFIYKALLGKFPKKSSISSGIYHLHTSKWLLLKVPWEFWQTLVKRHFPNMHHGHGIIFKKFLIQNVCENDFKSILKNAVREDDIVFLERPLCCNRCHYVFIVHCVCVLYCSDFFGCYLGQVSLVKEIFDFNGTSWLNKGKIKK